MLWMLKLKRTYQNKAANYLSIPKANYFFISRVRSLHLRSFVSKWDAIHTLSLFKQLSYNKTEGCLTKNEIWQRAISKQLQLNDYFTLVKCMRYLCRKSNFSENLTFHFKSLREIISFISFSRFNVPGVHFYTSFSESFWNQLKRRTNGTTNNQRLPFEGLILQLILFVDSLFF